MCIVEYAVSCKTERLQMLTRKCSCEGEIEEVPEYANNPNLPNIHQLE